MSALEPTITNLELRQSNEDGTAGAGLAHTAEGLFLLHVKELAKDGHPRGAATIVHDAGSHGGRYLDLARALAGDQWAVALPDMRGSGESEGDRGHSTGLQEVVRDIEEVQNHLAYRLTTEPRVLIGHGLGALYSLAYAAEKDGDLAALVLLAPIFSPSFTPPEEKKGLLARFMGPKVGPRSPGKIGFDPAHLLSTEDARAARSSDPLVHDVITLRTMQEAERAATAYAARLASLRTPVLVIAGSDDKLAPPSEIERHVSGSVELRTFDGARHDLVSEPDRAEICEFVREWLDAKTQA